MWPFSTKAKKNTEIGSLHITSRENALNKSQEFKSKLVISISDPELRHITRKHLVGLKAKLCELDMHDIERPAPEMTEPTSNHILDAINASRSIDTRHSIVVHCQAGVSRSSAIALILATERRVRVGMDLEQAICEGVKDIRNRHPHIRPNMLIVSLGGILLKDTQKILEQRCWECHKTTV